MTQDQVFMRIALAHAHLAQAAGEVPVGAVVVKAGKVIAVGRNAPIAMKDATAHAEIVALRAAAQALGNYRLDDCELYVTLEPCPMCAGAMLHSRLRRVVYGAKDPKTGASGSILDLFAIPQINHQTHVTGGVLAEECSDVLRTFFRKCRQIQAQQAQPLSEDALRTPSGAFASLQESVFTSRYFSDVDSTQGWRMHYLDEGPQTAPYTILCLHDVPGWGHHFYAFIHALSARGLRVLVPDLIGFGRSDKPKKAAVHTLAMHLRSLQALQEQLSPDGLLMVGQGAGTHVAKLLSKGMYRVFDMPTFIDPSVDMLPYPNRGYKAALLAAPQLVAQLRQAEATGHKQQECLTGAVNAMVDQLMQSLGSG